MPDLQLYTLVVASASQSQLGNDQRQQLAQSGILDEDGGITEQLSSNPSDQTLNGVYRGRYAEKMATELDELSSATGFEAVALAGMDGPTPLDGYYAVEEASVEPAQAQTGRAQRYELSLAKKGTRNKHWRALETNRRQIDHSWGNDLVAEVGVPAVASKVQWFNAEDGTRSPASPASTRNAELGDVEIYDLDAGESAVGTSTPTLLYEIDYTDEENLDSRIYDTRGHGAKHDIEGNLQWQKVFSTTHDFGDQLILDNGLLRLRLDEGDGTITPQRWDSSTGQWSTDPLGDSSGWSLFDVDLLEVAMAADTAQLTFSHDTEGLFALNATLDRGRESVLLERPENEPGPIPSGLESWLSPIAATTIVDPQATKGLVSRSNVRR